MWSPARNWRPAGPSPARGWPPAGPSPGVPGPRGVGRQRDRRGLAAGTGLAATGPSPRARGPHGVGRRRDRGLRVPARTGLAAGGTVTARGPRGVGRPGGPSPAGSRPARGWPPAGPSPAGSPPTGPSPAGSPPARGSPPPGPVARGLAACGIVAGDRGDRDRRHRRSRVPNWDHCRRQRQLEGCRFHEAFRGPRGAGAGTARGLGPVLDMPASLASDGGQLGLGIYGDGMAGGLQHGQVARRVGVGDGLLQVETVLRRVGRHDRCRPRPGGWGRRPARR